MNLREKIQRKVGKRSGRKLRRSKVPRTSDGYENIDCYFETQEQIHITTIKRDLSFESLASSRLPNFETSPISKVSQHSNLDCFFQKINESVAPHPDTRQSFSEQAEADFRNQPEPCNEFSQTLNTPAPPKPKPKPKKKLQIYFDIEISLNRRRRPPLREAVPERASVIRTVNLKPRESFSWKADTKVRVETKTKGRPVL